MRCALCEAPDRVLWSYAHLPQLPAVATGNWNELQRCPACGSLWVLSPYEPYASFPFLARWPTDAAAWHRLNDRDEARIVLEWHAAMIRETWRSLPPVEQADVTHWRNRTYRAHNPIDRAPGTFSNHFVESTADLARFL